MIKNRVNRNEWAPVVIVEVDGDKKKSGKKTLEETSEDVDLYEEEEYPFTKTKSSYPSYPNWMVTKPRSYGRRKHTDDDGWYYPNGWYN